MAKDAQTAQSGGDNWPDGQGREAASAGTAAAKGSNGHRARGAWARDAHDDPPHALDGECGAVTATHGLDGQLRLCEGTRLCEGPRLVEELPRATLKHGWQLLRHTKRHHSSDHGLIHSSDHGPVPGPSTPDGSRQHCARPRRAQARPVTSVHHLLTAAAPFAPHVCPLRDTGVMTAPCVHVMFARDPSCCVSAARSGGRDRALFLLFISFLTNLVNEKTISEQW